MPFVPDGQVLIRHAFEQRYTRPAFTICSVETIRACLRGLQGVAKDKMGMKACWTKGIHEISSFKTGTNALYWRHTTTRMLERCVALHNS